MKILVVTNLIVLDGKALLGEDDNNFIGRIHSPDDLHAAAVEWDLLMGDGIQDRYEISSDGREVRVYSVRHGLEGVYKIVEMDSDGVLEHLWYLGTKHELVA